MNKFVKLDDLELSIFYRQMDVMAFRFPRLLTPPWQLTPQTHLSVFISHFLVVLFFFAACWTAKSTVWH